MPNTATSPSFPHGAGCDRSEAHMREVRAKRATIEASYRAEGLSESYIAAHVSDELAERMLGYDRQVLGAIAGLFLGAR